MWQRKYWTLFRFYPPTNACADDAAAVRHQVRAAATRDIATAAGRAAATSDSATAGGCSGRPCEDTADHPTCPTTSTSASADGAAAENG